MIVEPVLCCEEVKQPGTPKFFSTGFLSLRVDLSSRWKPLLLLYLHGLEPVIDWSSVVMNACSFFYMKEYFVFEVFH